MTLRKNNAQTYWLTVLRCETSQNSSREAKLLLMYDYIADAHTCVCFGPLHNRPARVPLSLPIWL